MFDMIGYLLTPTPKYEHALFQILRKECAHVHTGKTCCYVDCGRTLRAPRPGHQRKGGGKQAKPRTNPPESRRRPAGRRLDGCPHCPEALDVGTATVARVRKRLVEEGLDAALNPRRQANRRRKIDGRAEAQLIATACSKPPEGYARWSLRMLGERLVELKCVDSISHEAIRQKLKKTKPNRG